MFKRHVYKNILNRLTGPRKFIQVLADAGINISYMYGTTSTGKTSTCLFSTSDNRKALKLINK